MQLGVRHEPRYSCALFWVVVFFVRVRGMSTVARSPDDPHWDLVLAIAAELLIDGIFVAELDSSATQARVDLQWSVREVGRIFRLATRVQTTTSSDPEGRTVTVRITREDFDDEAVVNGRARLEVLLRAIESDYVHVVIPPQPWDQE